MKKEAKKIIGRTDIVDFPSLALKNVSIKVDSGAYTSSIHCKNIREENGMLICKFLDPKYPNYTGREFVFKKYNLALVKSSNGLSEVRYAIKTLIRLFGKEYPITLTLSTRDYMRFPILIGRKFLSGKYIIDTELSNLSYNYQLTNEYCRPIS